MPKLPPNESTMDPSNILYNDRENYQIIFTNDSRFFDTSLHLFKSYRDLGYIQLDNKKSKKNGYSSSSNTMKTQTNRFNGSWRTKPSGFSSNHTANGNPNGKLKSPFLRQQGKDFCCVNFRITKLLLFELDHSISHRSDPGTSKLIASKMKRENSPVIVSSQRQSAPSKHSLANDDDDDSDDPDIIVTRL
jgi:hypothetical protein